MRRAFCTTPRILRSLRMMAGSFSSRRTSASVIAATLAGSNPWNARRIASHFAFTTL